MTGENEIDHSGWSPMQLRFGHGEGANIDQDGTAHLADLFDAHREILDAADGGYICDMTPAAVLRFMAAVQEQQPLETGLTPASRSSI